MIINTKNDSVDKKQNIHIILWLLKDTLWILNFKWLGLIMIVPTLSVAFFITYKSYNIKTDFLFNLAIFSWIFGNSTWMISDLFFEDTLKPFATFFLLVDYYYQFITICS